MGLFILGSRYASLVAGDQSIGLLGTYRSGSGEDCNCKQTRYDSGSCYPFHGSILNE